MKKQKDKPKRADKSEISNRVLEIYRLKLAGKTRSFILEYANKEWDISQQRTDQLIGEATKLVLEQNQASMEEDRAVIVSNLWDIYSKVVGSDPRLAVNIQESIAKLKGAGKVVPQEHKLEIVRDLEDLSDGELDDILGQDK